MTKNKLKVGKKDVLPAALFGKQVDPALQDTIRSIVRDEMKKKAT
jgi:hypothetical protein